MSKAEKFIQNYTMRCSNASLKDKCYYSWLTPDQARKAVEIAREEVIEKAIEWMKANITKYCTVRFKERNIPTPGYPFSEIMEKDFRKYMEEKI